MATVKSLVSGFVGYDDEGSHREVHLEVGQEFDANAVVVLARPELFTSPGGVAESPSSAGRRRGK
jgi:hypothetical protein